MSVTLDGETFSLSDFRGLGHVAILPASTVGGGADSEPRWPDRIFRRMLTELEAAEGVIQARDDAIAAASSTGASGTSSTSLTVGTGSKSLTTQTGKAFVAGQTLKIAATSTPTVDYMVGTVTSYNSGTGALVVNVTAFYGSGTIADWSISPTTDSIFVSHDTARIHNTLVVGEDYVVGYIDFDCTLNNLAIRANSGSGTIEAYLSSDETSASGVIITGGTFTVSTTVDNNALTAANTVSDAAPKYLVLKCTASTNMQNVTAALKYTKNKDD